MKYLVLILIGLATFTACKDEEKEAYIQEITELADELDSITGGGCVSVPNGPGLGVDYDWDFILANKTGSVHEYT